MNFVIFDGGGPSPNVLIVCMQIFQNPKCPKPEAPLLQNISDKRFIIYVCYKGSTEVAANDIPAGFLY